MRFERFVRRYSNTPWAIVPTVIDRLCGIVEMQIKAGKQVFLDELPEPKPFTVEMRGNVAILPVTGIIDKDIDQFDRISGAVDVDEISDALRGLIENDAIDAIVMDFDTPGGTVTGVPELADTIAEADAIKPIIGFTDSLCASAGYWMMASCRHIVASKSSQIGSIGVYLPVVDVSRAYENQGIKVDVIKAGDLKAAGLQGTILSAEQRADLQDGVDHVYKLFTEHVGKHRNTNENAYRGNTFFGDRAVTIGLVDEIGTLDRAIETARYLASSLTK